MKKKYFPVRNITGYLICIPLNCYYEQMQQL